MILISRVYLGVHSVNQVLYGFMLGSGIYYFFVNILCLQDFTPENFSEFFLEKNKIIIIAIFQLIILIFCILLYLFVITDTSKFEEILIIHCKDLKLYRKFSNSGFFGCLIIFFWIGAHYGIMFNLHILEIKKSNNLAAINEWNKTTRVKKIFIFLVMGSCVSPLIFYFIIPGTVNLGIILVFKVTIPFWMGGFGIYGLNIYFCIKYKIGNENYITYNDNTSSINDLTLYNANHQSRNIIMVEKDNFTDKKKSGEMY